MVQGRLDGAEGYLRNHLFEHPAEENARLLLITCLTRRGDLWLEDQEIAKVHKQELNNFLVHKSLMGTYYTLGRSDYYRAEIARYRQGWQRFEARLKFPKQLRLKIRSFIRAARLARGILRGKSHPAQGRAGARRNLDVPEVCLAGKSPGWARHREGPAPTAGSGRDLLQGQRHHSQGGSQDALRPASLPDVPAPPCASAGNRPKGIGRPCSTRWAPT